MIMKSVDFLSRSLVVLGIDLCYRQFLVTVFSQNLQNYSGIMIGNR